MTPTRITDATDAKLDFISKYFPIQAPKVPKDFPEVTLDMTFEDYKKLVNDYHQEREARQTARLSR